MPRPKSSGILLLSSAFLALLGAVARPASGQEERRVRFTPGLVLETGARHAACDMLTFTADGKTLLAAGDDKVVRSWGVAADGFVPGSGNVLRWPTYREQRGGIFALALSPGDEPRRVAVGGFGIKTGYLAVLDRATGEIRNALSNPPSTHVVWSLAWAPSGKHIVYGTENGELYRWDVGAKARTAKPFRDSASKSVNRVRLIAFLDSTRFLSVAQDGFIWERDRRQLRGSPKKLGRFLRPGMSAALFRVALSPDGGQLAAIAEQRDGRKKADIGWVKFFSLEDRRVRTLKLPQEDGIDQFPHSLAFDAKGERLAVGVRIVPRGEKRPFFKEIGGRIYVYRLRGKKLLPARLKLSYRPDRIAFRPGVANQLASAGGDNHEVCLWDLTGTGHKLAEIRGPGSSLWGVGLSRDNRYLGFREKRAANPATPNRWGAGAWRVFDLHKRRLLAAAPPRFAPVLPIETVGGWKVETTSDASLWNVVAPGGKRIPLDSSTGLFDKRVHGMPRCYTFLPDPAGKRIRLAVGHLWGASIYALEKPARVRLVRVLVGHEAEVMAVGPSADGKLLVTASRDQTIAGWSLQDWPSHPELGASFVDERGKILVKQVDPGSPAWEAGLTPGDEILMLVIHDDGFLFDPLERGMARYGFRMSVKENGSFKRTLAKLRTARPARELLFVRKHDDAETVGLTTVRQRPLWRFFPTRVDQGNDWVVWRWRDFYYATSSARADSYVGWHVNVGIDRKPEFYPLERLRNKFHRPDKVDKVLSAARDAPDKVIFADIEPPEVQFGAVKRRLRDADLVLSLSIRPRGKGEKQKVVRAVLWLDDYRYPVKLQPDARGEIKLPRLVIPRLQLRDGPNLLSLVAFNAEGGRGQQRLEVQYRGKAPRPAKLYALCVGLRDYRGVGLTPLIGAPEDARALAEVLRQHEKSTLYSSSTVTLLVDEKKTTPTAILAELGKLKKRARREDLVVLFLGGHGNARRNAPGSYYFVCANAKGSYLTGKQLRSALADLPSRKLVILDTCHSGDVPSNPVRDLTPDGSPLIVFSACKEDQESREHDEQGLFTQCLIEALGGRSLPAGKSRTNPVKAEELARYVRKRLPELLRKLSEPETAQQPEFYPERELRIPVLCKP
jgi:WD40 repeat protein